MRLFYLTLAAGVAMSLQAASPIAKEFFGEKTSKSEHQVSLESTYKRVPMKLTVEEAFACPENTVLDGPYIPTECGYQGFQSSDQGRPGMATKYYQAFHGCYKSVNAIRVIGMFNYFDQEDYDWYGCYERGAINEDYEMTEPVKFEISFYRMAPNGMPGECVYTKEEELIGRYLGVTYGFGDWVMPLYEFTSELDEEIRLESGFMSFSAVNTGEAPSCWFSLFTADTSLDYGCMEMGEYGMQFANLPSVFSFMGTGEYAAQKALKVAGITSLTDSSRGTHEKVIAKVINVGENEINDATLELWLDGQLIATETINATIPSEGTYKYTFFARVDLSAEGEHQVEVRNVTPGDEEISTMSTIRNTYTCGEGEACESGSYYQYDWASITSVKIGSIENESAESSYTDYMADCITDIHPGETLTLEVEPLEVGLVGVWIDWDNDGTFNGQGENIGYIYNEPLEVAIPEGIAVSEGVKRMRIVLDYYGEPASCGGYYFGETEDYGINVVRNANTASLSVSLDEISEEMNAGGQKEIAFELLNNGEIDLDATFAVNYTLPTIHAPRTLGRVQDFRSTMKSKAISGVKASNPAEEEEVQQILRYDGGFESAVGLGNYSTAIFAHYYPAEVMTAIKDMKLSSVDVYIHEVPPYATIKVFGASNDGTAGTVLAEQDFEAIPESWNHVVLDNPVILSGEDIWFGIELREMAENIFYVGIDGIPAVAGYGDLCNVGGSTWWSMMELGIDHNFCIRGNVTGERSDAINWLTLDKGQITVTPNNSEAIKATLNATNLPASVYEATIDITSNDELKPVYSIPVYLTKGMITGIEASKLQKTQVRVEAEGIVVTSEENIQTVEAYGVDGRKIAVSTKPGSRHEIALDNFGNSIYLFRVVFADGNAESFKIVVAK